MIKDEKILLMSKQIAEIISKSYNPDFRYLPNSSSFVIEAIK